MLMKHSPVFEVAPEALAGDEEKHFLSRLNEYLGGPTYQDLAMPGIPAGDSREPVATQPGGLGGDGECGASCGFRTGAAA